MGWEWGWHTGRPVGPQAGAQGHRVHFGLQACTSFVGVRAHVPGLGKTRGIFSLRFGCEKYNYIERCNLADITLREISQSRKTSTV